MAEANAVTLATTYLHDDALGSPVARTNSAGAVASRTSYEPYGKTASGADPTDIGFTGHMNDTATGLVYMQQRYYDPLAARFLSIDPIVANANTGEGFALYTYADNNPYSKVDADGRESGYAFHAEFAAMGGSPQLAMARGDWLGPMLQVVFSMVPGASSVEEGSHGNWSMAALMMAVDFSPAKLIEKGQEISKVITLSKEFQGRLQNTPLMPLRQDNLAS